jgi:hypothetical protein
MTTRPPIPQDDFTDSEFCLDQLINFWNVPVAKTAKRTFLLKMKDAGWGTHEIVSLEQQALRKSRWNNPRFFDGMVRCPELYQNKTDQEEMYAFPRK